MISMRSVGLAMLPLLALSMTGCATPTGTSCGVPAAAHDDAPRDMIVLGDDLSPLREAFNATSDRWRVLALVSPTCSECILGAEAVEREITSRYPAGRASALVVWIPMIPADSEDAARASATIFPAGRAQQYYDARQSLGWACTRQSFAGFMERARKFVPDDDMLAMEIDSHGGAERPQWDLYMLYAPGVRWAGSAGPPLPDHWIRHTGRRDGVTSTYWRDTPDAPPQQGDLFEAIREMARDALGESTALNDAVMRIEVVGLPGCPNAEATKAAVVQAVAALSLRADIQSIDQDALPVGDLRRSWPSPTVLVDGRDLFGMVASKGAMSSCRAYPGGAPSPDDVADVLHRFSNR
jgi:hypothetical protein